MTATPAPRLAVLAVCLQGDRVLLVRRRNPPDAGLWGFPGGHVDWGETLAAAAVRELAEETGITALPLGQVDMLELILRDGGGAVGHHFLMVAVLCRFVSGTPRAQDDALEAEWVPAAEVLAATRPQSADVDRVLARALDLALDLALHLALDLAAATGGDADLHLLPLDPGPAGKGPTS